MYSVVMRPAAVRSPNSRSWLTSWRSSGSISLRISPERASGRSASRSAAASGSISSTMSAARLLSSDSTIETWMCGSISSSASAATSSSMRLEHRLALGRRQVFDDVGDVGRVQLREPFVGDLQLDPPRRVGLDEIDELPRDHPRRDLVEQGAQGERGDDALGRGVESRRGRRRRRRPRSRATWLLSGVESISTSLTRTTFRPWTSMIC